MREQFEQPVIVIRRNQNSDSLNHYGIPNMKWGKRRFQDYSGAYTPEGRIRYGIGIKGRKTAKKEEPSSSTSNKRNKELFEKKTTEADDRTKAMEDDMKAINDGLLGETFAKNRRANCAFCTTAYELRRRGYDVIAKESRTGVIVDLDPSYAFKDAKMQQLESQLKGYSKEKWNEIEKQIVEEQGEGARGNLFGTYKNSMAGHSVAYEIQDGKMVILDCQVAKRYDDPHEFVKDFGTLNVIRTDNLKVDEDYINDYIGNRSEVKIRTDVGKVVADTLLLGGLGSTALGIATAALGGPGQIAVLGILTGAIAVNVGRVIKKIKTLNDQDKEEKEYDQRLDRTLKKLNIDFDEAQRRISEIYDKRYAPQFEPKPKAEPKIVVQPAMASRIKSLYGSGRYTQEELAKKLGISVSSVAKYV